MWLTDELRRAGYDALLIERGALGGGQTIASQGIIHGGMKYAITGAQRSSAQAIREMPSLWRDCIAGRAAPDLRGTRVRSDYCHMWRTTSWKSTLGMIGARTGLRSTAEKLSDADRPAALAGCPGDVYRIDEQVIDGASFVATLTTRHRDRIILASPGDDVSFVTSSPGNVDRVRLARTDGDVIELQPGHIVFTAGAGNAALRAMVGLSTDAMQRRPLHMVLVRGALPPLFGHCVDGAHTRVTVTSATHADGDTIWQLGGQVAEDGVDMDPPELMAHARAELTEALPGVDVSNSVWATYRIDRAEPATADGKRPAEPVLLTEGNVMTGWPTKLALIPRLATMIRGALPSPSSGGPVDVGALADWPRPSVAPPPWETDQRWVTID